MKTIDEILDTLEYIKRLHDKSTTDYNGLIHDELEHAIKLTNFLVS